MKVWFLVLSLFFLSGCLESASDTFSGNFTCGEEGYCHESVYNRCVGLGQDKAACLQEDYCFWCDDEYEVCDVLGTKPVDNPIINWIYGEGVIHQGVTGECRPAKGRCEAIESRTSCQSPLLHDRSFGPPEE